MEPTVSVVIPTYNSADTLAACLQAVFVQTHRPLEVIVADDGSTDATAAIAGRFGCVLVKAEQNAGPSTARNRGVAASTGEILFFLDSDVALRPDAIANAVRLLAAEPDLGCVHGMYTCEPLAEDTFIARYRLLHSFHWHQRSAGRVPTAFFALAAMPRRVFDDIGPFDENLRDSEDVEYSGRLHPRYAIRLTESIQGSHDDETRLGQLLRKQFHRSQMLVPVALAQRGKGSGGVRANRFSGVITAGLAVAALPFSLLWTPMLLVSLAMLAGFAFADPPLSRFVHRSRGAGFLARFTAVHFLVHVAIVAGASVGAVRGFADRDFGPSGRPRRRRFLSTLFMLVLLAAVVWALWDQDWRTLGENLGKPAAAPAIAGSLLANLIGLALAMLSWRAILVDSAALSMRVSARIFFVGMITKLVPGRIWSVLTHIRYGRAAGINATRMVAVYALNIPVGLLTAATVGLVAAPGVFDGNIWLLIVPAALAVVVFARPNLVNRLVAAALKLARRQRPDRFASARAMRESIAYSLVSWVVSGLHLWPLAVLFGADPWTALPVCVGGFAVAMAVGSLVLIVPDGWGAREVVLLLPLATILPLPAAAVVAVLSRIVVLLSEVLAAGLAVLAARSPATVDGDRRVPAGR